MHKICYLMVAHYWQDFLSWHISHCLVYLQFWNQSAIDPDDLASGGNGQHSCFHLEKKTYKKLNRRQWVPRLHLANMFCLFFAFHINCLPACNQMSLVNTTRTTDYKNQNASVTKILSHCLPILHSYVDICS